MNYIALTQLVPTVLSNIMLSSYCDRAGHKLPLILPAVGSFLSCSWLAMLTSSRFLYWPMETLLLFAFLNSALGGPPMVRKTWSIIYSAALVYNYSTALDFGLLYYDQLYYNRFSVVC